MTKTKTLAGTVLALLALVAALAVPASADARSKVRIGIGDQQPSMFDNPHFQALKIKRVRYFVRWDAMRTPYAREQAEAFVNAARRHKVRVFMHISSDNLTRKKAKLPKYSRYRRDVTRLVKHFRKRGVKEWGSRNEANHDSQATWKSPKRAAQEFKVVRRACKKGCTVVGLDVLDQKGATRYMQRFYKALGSYRKYVKIVGIHNYSDVNRKRTKGTRAIMKMAKRYNKRTKFWLTETGGLVRFAKFKYSENRAAARLKDLFKLTKRYRRDIQRVYVYNWTGADRTARFDAGVTNPDGSPRKAYFVLKSQLKNFLR